MAVNWLKMYIKICWLINQIYHKYNTEKLLNKNNIVKDTIVADV